jgi:hypothetical protein
VSEPDSSSAPGSDPSASTGAEDERSPGQQALDALVYAPAGLVLTVLEDLPALTAKGRARIGQQLRNAHAVGRLAVALGQQDLQRRFARPRPPTSEPGAEPTGADLSAAGASEADRGGPGEASGRPPVAGAASAGPATGPPGPPVPPVRPAPGDLLGRSGPPVDAAIPGYDTLSASQVVRRLDGLGTVELESVLRYETATRDRRTIVHRVQQLLGVEDPPGSSPPERAGD